LEEHDVDSPDGVKVAKSIDQFTDPIRWAATENRFQAPLTVGVMGRLNYVLKLVLDRMQVTDDKRVFVIKREGCCDVTCQFLKLPMAFDVFLDGFSDCP
jgi:hypothetical protein